MISVILAATLATSSVQMSESKLGVHLLGVGYTDGIRQVLSAGPRVIKILGLEHGFDPNMRQAMADYKRMFPDGIVVARVWTQRKWGLETIPEQAAREFYAQVLEGPLNKLTPEERAMIDYVEGPNEYDSTPAFESVEAARWYNRFWIKLARILARDGWRSNIGSIAVGNPGGTPEEIEAIWREFLPAMDAAHRLGGTWGYHSYTIHYSTDMENEQWYTFRYRKLREITARLKPHLADMPLILTEGGVDYAGNKDKDGWLARGTAQQFKDWLKWYETELQKDDYVLGVTLFQIGDPQNWPSFELETLAPWLADYLRRKR